jgi:hypothetical protein
VAELLLGCSLSSSMVKLGVGLIVLGGGGGTVGSRRFVWKAVWPWSCIVV